MLNAELAILAKVLIAAFLGGVIGLEREFLKKPAGLRTHILVGAAISLLVSLSYVLMDSFASRAPLIQGDPFKLFEALIVGISFIGAGVIMQRREEVKNLTTAASILIVATIGIAVGLEQYYVAVGVTLLAVFTNLGLGRVEAVIDKTSKRKNT